MASKRQSEFSSRDEPDAKRPTKTLIPPTCLGPISSLEEMDFKCLQLQNKMLASRLDVRRQEERELQQRIESLEAKQSAAEATLSLVNRHWSQLDDNVKVILQRLGVNKLPVTSKSESDDSDDESKASFVRMLTRSDFSQIKEELGNRVEFSRVAFGKVVDAIAAKGKRNEAILNAVTSSEDIEANTKAQIKQLSEENTRYQGLMDQLHAKHHKLSMESRDVEQRMESLEDDIDNLKTANDNLQWELQKARKREDRLNKHHSETVKKLNQGNENSQAIGPMTSGGVNLAGQKAADVSAVTEDSQTLADSRLKELEEMKTKHQDALKQLEQLKTHVDHPPESSIVASAEYQTLKSQFSLLYHESVQLKVQADESRALLQQTRNCQLRQIEQMEIDELQTQKNLRNELIQLEDTLAKVRHDYEMLHMEFEQNLAANEQAGPINREMRHLINSLQNHNRQLKGEIQRYKRKVRDLQLEVDKLKKSDGQKKDERETRDATAIKIEVKTEPGAGDEGNVQKRQDQEEIESKNKQIEELLEEIKSLEKKIAEQDLMMESYKDIATEESSTVDVRVREKKLISQVRDLEEKITKMEDERDKMMKEAIARESELLGAIAAAEKGKDCGRGGLPTPESQRKMKVLEETISELRRNVAATKQEEEALLSEMDVTGQAFEDMQEQNIRLVQQLREKDDANFKLMSERIKANQIQKLLREEKDVLQDQSITLHTQVESQNQVVRKLEEKERALQTTSMQMEKELAMRTQANDLYKRKAFELSQLCEDLRRDLEKSRNRLRITEESLDRKVEMIEEEHFKLSRAQENCAHLRRKLERQKKNDVFNNMDEILMEEIKEYKTKLRCPCCNVNNKDAVLTKCFHVFCLNCIKTRYDTRQRKCPKCNAGFGGNDFHRIYLE